MRVPNQPVSDTVPKINNEVALGQDLKFQYRWWRFERAVWILFAVLVVMDLLGVFGRGPLAKAHFVTPDHSMDISYERVERFSTPSILRVKFSEKAIHDGKVLLFVSDSLVKTLGNQRVVPEPRESLIGNGGILYTFSASEPPAQADFALSPSSPGSAEIKLQVPGHDAANLKIFVVP